jgi:hypothetical protein
MKLFLLTFLLAMTSSAFARGNDQAHRPRSFSTSNGRAVFADFSDALYTITYDATKKQASAVGEMTLSLSESGNLIFDSVEVPTAITLDGEPVTATETRTPGRETIVRVIDKSVSSGTHKLMVSVPLKNLVDFNSAGVKSAFWTSDLSDRNYLERYLPANFEFDQVKMTFIVKFIGTKSTQVIYTNGAISKIDSSTYKISYPAYYTSSSIFFHTVPQGATDELRFSIRSIDGRELPAVVYAPKPFLGGRANLDGLKQKTIEVIAELEGDYGPFLHSSVTVYNAGSGGMEYCGATMTEKFALGHELFHSYFARGVMPANGNTGWIDEALASWRDEGYQSSASMLGTSGMSNHPYYTRSTDTAAYNFGERFMRYLDHSVSDKGGLKPFLRYMVERRSKAPLFVEEFISEMTRFYGKSMEADFRKYTYGSPFSSRTGMKSMNMPSKRTHRKMPPEELQKYL